MFGTIHRHYSPARCAVGCAMMFVMDLCLVCDLILCIWIYLCICMCVCEPKAKQRLRQMDELGIVNGWVGL